LNPKALTLGELYGEYNASTQEWKDGVLSSLMRLVCSGCQHLKKYKVLYLTVELFIRNCI